MLKTFHLIQFHLIILTSHSFVKQDISVRVGSIDVDVSIWRSLYCISVMSSTLERLFDASERLLAEKAKSDADIEGAILAHIAWCSQNIASVCDFKTGREWFNVSKPLQLRNELKEKIVVLDFFTYCCINCMHIFPHLKLLEEEFSVENGVVVVGVHSAKFDNEKDSANIQAALQRYGISHPVINDCEGIMWNTLGIPCWPTILILGPYNIPIYVSMGESNMEQVFLVVRYAVKHYRSQGILSRHSLPLAQSLHVLPQGDDSLCFPGKITSWKEGGSSEWLAVSDSGHHRILLLDDKGNIQHVVGASEPGFADGSFSDARFNSPQGVAFGLDSMLYVADTENHAVRLVNMKTLHVSTVAGNGSQGKDVMGGGKGIEQALSSPWDVCFMVHPVLKTPILLIAMAGSHQIWALFLQDTCWWKGKNYTAGTCVAIAGTGREENRNNSYPHAAGFAQPSGLSLAEELQAVFIADSESSSIRRLSLVDGKVSAVVGGDRIPSNLFGFGDMDGKLYDAKLQHPLAVAWNPHRSTLYVADTYNHKLKAADVSSNIIHTLQLSANHGGDPLQLNEPGGLCISSDGNTLYVADTNSHCIKVMNLDNLHTTKLDLKFPKVDNKAKTTKTTRAEVYMSPLGGIVKMSVHCSLQEGLSLTAGAPQRWKLHLPDHHWLAPSCGGDFSPKMQVQVTVPKDEPGTNSNLLVTFRLYVCQGTSRCSMENFQLELAVKRMEGAPSTLCHTFHIVVT